MNDDEYWRALMLGAGELCERIETLELLIAATRDDRIPIKVKKSRMKEAKSEIIAQLRRDIATLGVILAQRGHGNEQTAYN
jgi:hypothetical protein